MANVVQEEPPTDIHRNKATGAHKMSCAAQTATRNDGETAMKLLTANRLSDGVVVFRNSEGGWVRDVRQAHIVDATDLDRALADAERDVTGNRVIGVAAVDARIGGAVEPSRLREQIRAFGPTIDYRATGRRVAQTRVAA